jgi:hypothetical protein
MHADCGLCGCSINSIIMHYYRNQVSHEFQLEKKANLSLWPNDTREHDFELNAILVVELNRKGNSN